MRYRFFIFIFSVLFLYSCSKKEAVFLPSEKVDPYILYKEGVEAFEKNDYFYANKKFYVRQN